MRESMCDSCMSPGACCKSLHLRGGYAEDGHRLGDGPMSFERAEHLALKNGLWMMRPLYQDENGWRWSCTALGRDGRCTIYEDRPDLCRRYLPGEDGLCVHYWPGEPELTMPEPAEEKR